MTQTTTPQAQRDAAVADALAKLVTEGTMTPEQAAEQFKNYLNASKCRS